MGKFEVPPQGVPGVPVRGRPALPPSVDLLPRRCSAVRLELGARAHRGPAPCPLELSGARSSPRGGHGRSSRVGTSDGPGPLVHARPAAHLEPGEAGDRSLVARELEGVLLLGLRGSVYGVQELLRLTIGHTARAPGRLAAMQAQVRTPVGGVHDRGHCRRRPSPRPAPRDRSPPGEGTHRQAGPSSFDGHRPHPAGHPRK